MYSVPLFIIGFAVVLSSVDSYSSLRNKYDHAMYLDESEKYELLWTVDHAKGIVSFATVVNTTGWVGFGIAKGLSGKMGGADIAIGYVLNDGSGHLVDRYATGNKLPERDDKQDYLLLGHQELNGQTILRFNRSIEACDEKDNSIQSGTTKLIFAYGLVDPNPKDDSSVLYHSNRRGSRSVNLLNYAKHTATFTAGKYVDLKMNNVKIPKKETTYWCTAVKISRSQVGGGKRHITKIAPIVQPGNEGLVHHLVIYDCGSEMMNDTHLGVSFECKSPNMPPEQHVAKCRAQSILYVWAVGGEPLVMPDIAGLPIGENENTYYLLEMHYDNPDVKQGQIDSSGLRLYYTEDLRKHDANTLTAGMPASQDLLIPPGQKAWVDTAYCYPGCTKNLGKINVFAAFPHMHTAGAGLVTKLVRNGKQVAEIIRDDNYDFNYQQTHMLPKEVVVTGGDSIITECRFNTESRKTPTFGGQSSIEEMCFSFLLYYPKTNVVSCNSDNYNVGRNFSSKYAKKEGHKYNWENVTWTDDMVTELKKIQQSANLLSICTFDSGTRNETLSAEYLPKPVIRVPLPQPQSRCQSETGSGSSQLKTSLVAVLGTSIVALMLVLSR